MTYFLIYSSSLRLIFNHFLLKIGSVPANTEIMNLKLIKAGISKDVIAMISLSLSGIILLLMIAIGKFISGQKAMNVFLQSTIIRYVNYYDQLSMSNDFIF